MNKQIVTPRTQDQQAAQHAAQAAVQAALALRRMGYHDAAKAIWDASKGVIAA